MELLSPSPPPQPTAIYFAGFPSPAPFLHRFNGQNLTSVSPTQGIAEDFSESVHVAVGKSMEKGVGLLNWTFRQFAGREISLVHVHQPSPTIPTLLGKLPASQANEELVLAHRRDEREHTEKILLTYLNICNRAKVQAKIIVTETGQVQKGIVDLVAAYGIRKLVMGAVPDNCMKVKRRSTKADYTAKNAPPFCEIWFVNRGKHIWTREASEISTSLPPLVNSAEIPLPERLKSKSSHGSNTEPAYNPDYLRSCSSFTGRHCGSSNGFQTELDKSEALVYAIESSFICTNDSFELQNPTSSRSTASGLTSPAERWIPSEKSKEEQELELLYNLLIEARTEVETSKKEAFEELLKRKRLESEAAEAFSRVKAFEAARASETELRKEVEDAIRTTKQEQEKLSKQRDEAMRELQKTKRTVAILDSHAREAARQRDEATGELKLIQASIATLRLERQKMRRQREESVRQLEQWRKHGQIRTPNYDGFAGMPEFREFSFLDLQTATFNFSESFKIGQGGYGCVYKGEMLDRSVAIKKFHPHNMQGPSEFQQEVHILSKLHHPHLVTLIGACPEACSLVYDYFPNGSLQDRLFRKTSAPPLTWNARTRIAAEISSALLFLHSSKPDKIVHGDLKPENIFLDSKFNCKIGDFGISRLVPEENVNCRTFFRNTEPKGAFPYMDPEFQRTGDLTPKSDVYSFGIIILQLVTGRPPVGLVGEVRRAVLAGKLCTVLDPSAGEWHTFVARRLVEMGLQCSEMNSRDRLELTPEVVKELEQLHVVEERPVPTFFLCPILREIMHDPQVAADGFTYEGEALRGWLENGRETSPMTNLKLAHLDLTPNYALRSAIQDWLCQ